MWERAATEIAEATGGKMEEVIKGNGKSVPVGRYGTSEEVASLVTFLCPMQLLILVELQLKLMEVNQDISKWKHIRVLVIANKYYLVLKLPVF